MKKDYQTRTDAVATAVEAVMPDAVNVALAELAGSLREGLLALAVGAGLQVMDAIISENVAALAGPRGRHDPDRTAVGHGTEDGSVTLGRAAGADPPASGPHRRPHGRGGGAGL